MAMNYPFSQFSSEDIAQTQPALKIGLLATLSEQGKPHISLLSSLMACGERQLCFGQFTEGLSKKYVRMNPRCGFLIMGLDKNLWRGKAVYTHSAREGAEYDYYNNVPMFRYNAYFGVHTVHYLDLVGQSGKQPLPMNRIIFAAVLTMFARGLGRKSRESQAINEWTRDLLNKLGNLKFIAYVDEDGFPTLIPVIQLQCLDGSHLVFSSGAYGEELAGIPNGAELAVFGMSLTMEDVLLRGRYTGLKRVGGVKAGVLEVDWVYNSMPPVPGQIYPPQELGAVMEF
ncbi:MAG: hypothetical protein ACOY16_02045 [Chloroflexota bacterium]